MSSPAVIGLRAQRGGAAAVAVAAGPRVVLSALLATADEGDRLAFEPYHVAREAGDLAAAEAAVAEGRRRQAALAASGLDALVRRLRDTGWEPVAAALLVNRAGWVTDLLQYSLGAPEHPAVAEGLAVRDALRDACAARNLNLVEVDEKSLPGLAPTRLGLAAGDVDAALAGLGAAAGKPWRKEQKLAALAAWVTVGS